MKHAQTMLAGLVLVISTIGCGSSSKRPAVPPGIKVGGKVYIGLAEEPNKGGVIWDHMVIKEIRGNWIKADFVPQADSNLLNVKGGAVWVNFDTVNFYSILDAEK